MLILPVVNNSGIRLNPNPASWPATKLRWQRRGWCSEWWRWWWWGWWGWWRSWWQRPGHPPVVSCARLALVQQGQVGESHVHLFEAKLIYQIKLSVNDHHGIPCHWHVCTGRGFSRSDLEVQSRWERRPAGPRRSTSGPKLPWTLFVSPEFVCSSNHLNMKTLLCILISVMEEGGRECATATKPTLGSDVLGNEMMNWLLIYLVHLHSNYHWNCEDVYLAWSFGNCRLSVAELFTLR